MTAFDIVTTAIGKLFTNRNIAAADDYFAPTYIQHSTLAADGIDGLKTLVANLPDGFRYDGARIIADDQFVVLHGTYHGFGDTPLVAFDIFRVADGKIVEHWDALTPEVAETASGRSQVDGTATTDTTADTDANRQLIADFVDQVLIGGDYLQLTRFISTDSYAQHNPEAADGLSGFGAAAEAWAAAGKNLVYKKLHQIIAQDDFVFTRSEGTFGEPVVYNDLWRIADGKIVEHWDVITPIPADDAMPHTNGVF